MPWAVAEEVRNLAEGCQRERVSTSVEGAPLLGIPWQHGGEWGAKRRTAGVWSEHPSFGTLASSITLENREQGDTCTLSPEGVTASPYL